MPCQIINNSHFDVAEIKDLIQDLHDFSQKRLGFKKPPVLNLVSDEDNKSPLGKTAHYDPNSMEITIFVDGRHPKDIMRSFAHELVHHCQNENGMFDDVEGQSGDGYAQSNPYLRKMEKEAYLKGNMCFRDWEDGYKSSNPNILNERRIYKMSTKKWKNKELNTLLNEKWGFSMNLGKLNEGSCGSATRDDDEKKKLEEEEPKEKEGSKGMTPKQKKFAALADPKDKITYADKIAGATGGKEEQNEEMNEAKVEVENMSLEQIQSFLEILKDLDKFDGDIADMAKKIKEKYGTEKDNEEEEKHSDMDMKERKLREAVRKIIKSKLSKKKLNEMQMGVGGSFSGIPPMEVDSLKNMRSPLDDINQDTEAGMTLQRKSTLKNELRKQVNASLSGKNLTLEEIDMVINTIINALKQDSMTKQALRRDTR